MASISCTVVLFLCRYRLWLWWLNCLWHLHYTLPFLEWELPALRWQLLLLGQQSDERGFNRLTTSWFYSGGVQLRAALPSGLGQQQWHQMDRHPTDQVIKIPEHAKSRSFNGRYAVSSLSFQHSVDLTCVQFCWYPFFFCFDTILFVKGIQTLSSVIITMPRGPFVSKT